MFAKEIKIVVLVSVFLSGAANLAVARGGGGADGGDGGGDHVGAHNYSETRPGVDRGRDSGRPGESGEKSTAYGCLQMIVVDPAIPNASKDCGYKL